MIVHLNRTRGGAVDSPPANTRDRTADSLGQVVRSRRRAIGLRQEDLADLAEVSHRFVQALEAGKPTVRLDKVEAVLDALGLRLAAVPKRSS
jgi:HTH-type transcriptional regulator/antitoxin HipB